MVFGAPQLSSRRRTKESSGCIARSRLVRRDGSPLRNTPIDTSLRVQFPDQPGLLHGNGIDRDDSLCRTRRILWFAVAVDVHEGLYGPGVHEAGESVVDDLETHSCKGIVGAVTGHPRILVLNGDAEHHGPCVHDGVETAGVGAALLLRDAVETAVAVL